MGASLSSQIHHVLRKTHDNYYKLILAVGSASTGKTVALNEIASQHQWPRVNVNLRLSEKLLELTHRQRAVRVAGILADCDEDRALYFPDRLACPSGKGSCVSLAEPPRERVRWSSS